MDSVKILFMCACVFSSRYVALNGPSEFTITGELEKWSIVDRNKDVYVPALVLGGQSVSEHAAQRSSRRVTSLIRTIACASVGMTR